MTGVVQAIASTEFCADHVTARGLQRPGGRVDVRGDARSGVGVWADVRQGVAGVERVVADHAHPEMRVQAVLPGVSDSQHDATVENSSAAGGSEVTEPSEPQVTLDAGLSGDSAETARNRAEEAQWAVRFRQGDRAAFSELVKRHQRSVFFVVWRYVRNEEDAKDLTQAAFVKAWQNAEGFRGDASFKTWILRIASNLALNFVRDRGRWPSDQFDDEHGDRAPSAGELLANAEESDRLRQAVETLPTRQRQVVELRVQEGLSFKEVADVVACSEDAAKANFHHALKRLRSVLGSVSH